MDEGYGVCVSKDVSMYGRYTCLYMYEDGEFVCMCGVLRKGIDVHGCVWMLPQCVLRHDAARLILEKGLHNSDRRPQQHWSV